MTERVYQQISYNYETEAKIVKIDNNRVILDRTIFYPTSGGQSADTGNIDNYRVIDVKNEDNEIVHIIDRPFKLPENNEELGKVHLKIDWEHRYDNMQQHTGQHLLSAVLLKLLHAETVSSHLGTNYNTVDVSVPMELNDEAINKIELYANSLIYNRIPVKSYFPSSNELNSLILRRKPKVKENIRVVEIEGTDITPCGGTHLSNTVEITILKIIKAEKYKGMYRIYFLCGRKAFLHYLENYRTLVQTADFLSVPLKEVPLRTKNLMDKSIDQSKLINSLKGKLAEFKIDTILKNMLKINTFYFLYDVNNIESNNDETLFLEQKDILKHLKKLPAKSILLFLEINRKKLPAKMTLSIKTFPSNSNQKISALYILDNIISKYNGKGGGSKKYARGIITIKNDTPSPEMILKTIENILRKQ